MWDKVTDMILWFAVIVIGLFYLLFGLGVVANWKRANRHEQMEDWIDDVERKTHTISKVKE
jgi:uncharacterized membrane protein YeiB